VQLWESKKEKKLVGEVSKVQTQGSVELGGEKEVESYQEKEGIYENKQGYMILNSAFVVNLRVVLLRTVGEVGSRIGLKRGMLVMVIGRL
jgi:hypothetical protein